MSAPQQAASPHRDPTLAHRIFLAVTWIPDCCASASLCFMIAFPDMRVVMDEVLARGDRAEYDWTLIGTNSGPGGTGQRCLPALADWSGWTHSLLAGPLRQLRKPSSTRALLTYGHAR